MSSGVSPSNRVGWEAWLPRITALGPYVTLAAGTVFAFLSGDGPADPLATSLLVALTSAWIYFLYTRPGPPPQGRARAVVYYLGFVALSALLILQHPLFYLVPVAAFFHVQVLGSPALVFMGLLLASIVTNSLIVYPDPAPGAVWIFSIVVVVQTVAIGLGVLGTEKIITLSAERARALAELERLMSENKGLHAQLLAQAHEAGVSDERQRLAREIHDTVTQGLIGVITQLEASQGSSEPDREQRIDNAKRIARESLVEARHAVRADTPALLDGKHLRKALEEVVSSWSALTRVPARFTVTGEPLDLPNGVEASVLRVTQEALANVARHASASHVAVTLSYMRDVVALDVCDDGVGIGPGAATGGSGLAGMRARAAELGGLLHLESEPGGGTALCLEVPTSVQEFLS